MSGKNNGNPNSGNLGAKDKSGQEKGRTKIKPAMLEVEKEMEIEKEGREEVRNIETQNEQQDLIQGMQTGTYDSKFQGIHWGPSYRLRKTKGRAPQDKQRTGKK